jgi:hypothetical protein
MSYNPNLLYELGIVEPNTEQDDAYKAWLEEVREYYDSKDMFPHRPAAHFWIIVRMLKGNYSHLLTFHDKIPMMIPKKGHGELYAIASSDEEVRALTTPADENDPKSRYVYLVYKARVPGGDGWRGFLDLLADNHLLEKESTK